MTPPTPPTQAHTKTYQTKQPIVDSVHGQQYGTVVDTQTLISQKFIQLYLIFSVIILKRDRPGCHGESPTIPRTSVCVIQCLLVHIYVLSYFKVKIFACLVRFLFLPVLRLEQGLDRRAWRVCQAIVPNFAGTEQVFCFETQIWSCLGTRRMHYRYFLKPYYYYKVLVLVIRIIVIWIIISNNNNNNVFSWFYLLR